MSKQYLTQHTIDDAHVADIFSVAATQKALFSASGSSTLNIYDTTTPIYPLLQSIPGAHKTGVHHLAASANGSTVASAGFGGEVKIWKANPETGEWTVAREFHDEAGEVWAIALSENGKFMAATTHDGRVTVRDVSDGEEGGQFIKKYDTAGAGAGVFGLAIDLSANGKYTASGQLNGTVYVFDNDLGRLVHSLPGLANPVRAVAFSPGSTKLAAAGDAGVIAIYDMKHGDPVQNLTGHKALITSLSWSHMGDYLLSASFDGKIKVWSLERGICVATHSETEKAVWSATWLPRTSMSKAEVFVTGGANRSLCFYREASGG